MLNMSLVRADDSTTQSRIRDSALLLFGRDGYDGTSVRAIATDASVSAALVIHHFGTKAQLRTACDEYVVRQLRDGSEIGDPYTVMAEWLENPAEHRVSLDYLTHLFTSGSDIGHDLFSVLVDRTHDSLAEAVADGTVRSSSEPRMRAVLIATQVLGALILEKHLDRLLGTPSGGDTAMRRLAAPNRELLTDGLYVASEESFAAAAPRTKPGKKKNAGKNTNPEPRKGKKK